MNTQVRFAKSAIRCSVATASHSGLSCRVRKAATHVSPVASNATVVDKRGESCGEPSRFVSPSFAESQKIDAASGSLLNTRHSSPRLPSTKEGRLPCMSTGCSLADSGLGGLRTTLLNGNEHYTPVELNELRNEIMQYFEDTYTLFEVLHTMLADSPAFFEKHETLRHPPIFYMGHTSAFYLNKLHLGKFINTRIDPVLEMQMAVGVDEMSWDDWDSNSYVWPSGQEARADPEMATAFLQKVLDFRRNIRVLLRERMQQEPMVWPITKDSFWYVILMGIEHDRIHAETSSVILRQAKLSAVQPIDVLAACPHGKFDESPNSPAFASVPSNRLVPIERGTTRIGREWKDTKTYGWDNEFGRPQQIDVPAFDAGQFLVSNREFYDFIQADGYKTERYWSKEGWAWVSDMKPTQPRFWVKVTPTELDESTRFRLRCLCNEVAMPWDWPVECSNHEAVAFCNYLSEKTGQTLRLPMEDEYMRIRDLIPTDLQDSAHGKAWPKNKVPGNINLSHWASACPVDMFPTEHGVYDAMGNVWQHSVSDIDVLDGFQSHPLYDDFTTPTVDGMHARIMGGSFISTGANGATRDSRYGFRRHFYQHAGFRYIRTDRPVVSTVTPFESNRDTCSALSFHFGAPTSAPVPPDGNTFHESVADACLAAAHELFGNNGEHRSMKVMEYGCGPGRLSLELARRGFGTVHATDRTANSFQLTTQKLLGDEGRLRWCKYLEGDLRATQEYYLSDLGTASTDGKGSWQDVQFLQIPDLSSPDLKKLHDYDLVVIAQPRVFNSITNPVQTLEGMHMLLKPGGIFVFGTSYEWTAGSAYADGNTSCGEDVVATILSRWFDQVLSPLDVPFVQAQTNRKFACGQQHLTYWRRRAMPREGVSTQGSVVEAAIEAKLDMDASMATKGQVMYEESDVVNQYLEFHFGPNSKYPARCASLCVEAARQLKVPMGRALEVGCGPGRAAMELSKSYKHVDAGDFSERFVDVANKLTKEQTTLKWKVVVDNTSMQNVERSVSSSDQLDSAANVNFKVLDAQNLPENAKNYDLICGFNLVDRLPQPKSFLKSAAHRLNPEGLLILSSPYTWCEEFTAKEEWLGGFKYGDNDAPSSYDGMKETLLAEGMLEALPPQDVWFRIDELANGRKFQQTRAQVTFWQRKVE